MGMLSLNRLALKQKKRRRRRRIQGRNGLVTSVPKEKDSLCQENDCSQGGERSGCSEPNLPEHIWCHINSLMALRDSARSACVSYTFLRSWKCHPMLTFTEEALGLKQMEDQKTGMDFANRVDLILKNHSGTGVKIFKLIIPDHCNVSTCHLTNWLQNAMTPGIEEVSLFLLPKHMEEYNFPCSIFRRCGNSIRYLHLAYCAFRPTIGFNFLRSLTKLDLQEVCITGDELSYVISSCFALEHLSLGLCNELIFVKIPFWLERLNCLKLTWCRMLQVVDSAAPNLSTFGLIGDTVEISFGKSSHVKNLNVGGSFKPNIVSYAITKLPAIAPHIETLTISSFSESIDTPMVADKFLHLKHLKIFFFYCLSPIFPSLQLYVAGFVSGCCSSLGDFQLEY